MTGGNSTLSLGAHSTIAPPGPTNPFATRPGVSGFPNISGLSRASTTTSLPNLSGSISGLQLHPQQKLQVHAQEKAWANNATEIVKEQLIDFDAEAEAKRIQEKMDRIISTLKDTPA